jgi:protein farnesyltransferase/geranylgeranyltransferase type-1 subunit alpha
MSLSDLFQDIDPIPADDGPHPVCCIDYPSEFEEAHGYLRAVLKRNEKTGEKEE